VCWNAEPLGPRRGLCEGLHDGVDRFAGLGAHLFVACILNWMGHVDRASGKLRQAEGFGLLVCRAGELARRHHHRGDTPGLVVCQVVHTARRAGPSIRQRLDHDPAALCDLVAQTARRGLREGRLAQPEDLFARRAQAQEHLELIEENVAARLCDIHEADGAPQTAPARRKAAPQWATLRGRIKNHAIAVTHSGHSTTRAVVP
jgi:hypothetical protein